MSFDAEIIKTETHVIVQIDVGPYAERDDTQVDISAQRLVVAAQTGPERSQRIERHIALPCHVDPFADAKAILNNGQLEITMKRETPGAVGVRRLSTHNTRSDNGGVSA